MPDEKYSEDQYQPRLVETKADQFVVLTGCSGAGKSSLLAELARRGFPVFEEPGRQIVKEQAYIGGDAFPWQNPGKFLEQCIFRAMHQMISAARSDRRSFFDRGIVDAFCGLETLNMPVPEYFATAVRKFRYHRKVFFMPPWKEIFKNDEERRHSFEDAVAGYDSLIGAYQRLGYEVVVTPKLDIVARADFILSRIS